MKLMPPETLFTVQETRALAHAMTWVEGRGADRDAVRSSVGDVLAKLQVQEAADHLIQTAMAKIADANLDVAIEVDNSAPDRKLFSTTALAWTLWARGEPGEAERILREDTKDDIVAKGSAIHLMALHCWRGAVEALLRGSMEEARKLFLRAIDIGAQAGTETGPAIQWAYAASFFH